MNRPTPHPHVLIIAGSDPSCGAGCQADIKTVSALGGYACMAVTALVVENTRRVESLNPVPAELIERQCEIVLEDVEIDAVKIGMAPTVEAARAIARVIKKWRLKNVVWDPVMAATSGDSLIEKDSAAEGLRDVLLPLAEVVTPNALELARLAGARGEARSEAELLEQSEKVLGFGAKRVLAKGGHMTGPNATDWLVERGKRTAFSKPRVETNNTHGSGCTYSSAIACLLAQRESVEQAVKRAKEYEQRAIEGSKNWKLGKGHGPLKHFDEHAVAYEWTRR